MKGAHLGEFEELVLLTIGVLQGDAYGVAIGKYLTEKTGRTPSIGALHSALTRLEQKGCLVTHLEGATDERRGRRKKFYSLTGLGTATLKELYELRSEMIKTIPNLI